MRKCLQAFLILAMGLAGEAHAAKGADCSARFRAAGKVLPQKLLSMGYTKFDRLDLRKFIRDIDAIRIIPGMNKIGMSDMRSTARWTVKNGVIQIEVDCARFDEFPAERPQVAAHEYSGPLRFADGDHWMTNLMWVLTLPETRQTFKPDEIAVLEENLRRVARVGGGGIIGLGGGGESSAVAYNNSRIRRAMRDIRKAKSKRERDKAGLAFDDAMFRYILFIEGPRLDAVKPFRD